MLTHPMLDQLAFAGMAQAFAEIEASDAGTTLSHADWLGLLVDREITHRRDKRLAARLRYARLRHHAVVEDIDYRTPRGLDRGLFHKLAGGEWIDAHDNLIPASQGQLCAARPASAKVGLLVLSGTRPTATTDQCSISASQSCCSPISHWPAATAAMHIEFSRNNMPDFEKLQPTERRQNKAALLEQWQAHLRTASTVYTRSDDNALLHFGWLTPQIRRSLFTEVNQIFRYPLGGILGFIPTLTLGEEACIRPVC